MIDCRDCQVLISALGQKCAELDAAVASERERVLGLIEAELSWRSGTATKFLRDHLLDVVRRIREAQ